MVYIPGWVSNIDLMWDCPELVDFFKQMSSVVRIILFDKRGTGLSDRVSDLSTLEERMDDIRAVMDAVGSEKAILFGHSEGGSVSALFSATYPQRTEGLITFGVFAKRRWSQDYPWAPTNDERQKVYEMIDNHWGSGEMDLVSLAPSKKHDSVFMDWLARYFRSGASPSAALALTRMNTQIDIRGILDSISVPTLLMFRTNDIDVKIEEGRYIATQIQKAKFVEFSGEDHLFWAGDYQSIIEEMTQFIESECKQRSYTTMLSTVLKLKKARQYHGESDAAVGISKVDLSYDDIIKSKIEQYLGAILDETDDYVTASFPGPSKAVYCAIDIQKLSQIYKVDISQGLHIGEIELINGKISEGVTLEITDRILNHASPNQILITNTVNNLLSGTGLDFEQFGLLTVNTVRQIDILSLKKISMDEVQVSDSELDINFSRHASKTHSLLENVIQSIENNMTDEGYSIQMLSNDIGISPRQLQRRIKAITNKSPNTLIRSIRLHKAKELLLQEKRSVKEVAYLTGFGSVSYFSSCFKKEFGMSPSTAAP